MVQEHDTGNGVHWDLMLEAEEGEDVDALATWSLLAPPGGGTAVRALRIADHRKAYLDYEGPISGGRGTVRIWDRGTCLQRDLGVDRIELALAGERLRGMFVLSDAGEVEGGKAVWTFAPAP